MRGYQGLFYMPNKTISYVFCITFIPCQIGHFSIVAGILMMLD